MRNGTYDKPVDGKVSRTFTVTVAVDEKDWDNPDGAHWIENAINQGTSFRVEHIEEDK